MVMTFILTPRCHYNTITKPRAHFLYSLLKGLSIDFPSCMILSILDTFHDNASHDKLIFSSFIKHILIHASVSIPSSFHFSIMGAIGKESIVRSFPSWSLRPSIHELILLLLSGRKQSFVREEAKFRAVEDAAYTHYPSTSSTPSSSSSSRVDATLLAILDQLQLICDAIGEIRDT